MNLELSFLDQLCLTACVLADGLVGEAKIGHYALFCSNEQLEKGA